MGIGMNEWLSELEALSKRSDAGHTTDEIAENTGMSTRLVRERLKDVAKIGRLRVGRRSCTTIDGKTYLAPVYTIIGKEKD